MIHKDTTIAYTNPWFTKSNPQALNRHQHHSWKKIHAKLENGLQNEKHRMWNLASMHAYGERIVLIYQRSIQKLQFEDG